MACLHVEGARGAMTPNFHFEIESSAWGSVHVLEYVAGVILLKVGGEAACAVMNHMSTLGVEW